ncbi:MAG: enolase C-terminal domain-like protein [Verrucomicrobiota bacterium]
MPDRLSFADVPGSMDYLNTLSPGDLAAKCALNLALVDGAARQARQPVYDFFGLGFREQHHVTSFSIGIDRPEIIRKKVLAARDYPVLKLKVGVPDEKAILTALREVAPTKPIRVDANEGWQTKEQALERIEWLARDGHIQFIEQPMPQTTHPRDLVWLKERSPLPLLADESYHSATGHGALRRMFSRRERKAGQDRGRERRVRSLESRPRQRVENNDRLHDRDECPDQRRRASGRVVRFSRRGRKSSDDE